MSLTIVANKFHIDEKYGIYRRCQRNSIPEHTHDFIELVYMYRGKCTHTVNGVEYKASHGDMLFVNYNCTHSMLIENEAEYIDILIKPEFVDENLRGTENAFVLLALEDFKEFSRSINKENVLVHFFSGEDEEVETVIGLAQREMEDIRPGNEMIARSCLNILLTAVFRKMALPMKNQFKMNDRLLAYIQENCEQPMQLKHIAEKCNYNPTYFSRMFKKKCGVSFSKYLSFCRIEKAYKMLTETEFSVDEVICKCGITDRSKFFMLFKEKYGKTPKTMQKGKK